MKCKTFHTVRKKIAILSVYGQSGYGVFSVIKSQVFQLLESGYKIDFFTIHDGNVMNEPELSVFEIPGNIFGLRDILEYGDYHAVIAHTPPFYALLPSLTSTSTILYDHGEPPADWFPSERIIREELIRKKQTDILPHVDRVIAISEFIAQSIHWPNSIILPNGADHLWRKYPTRSEKRANKLPKIFCVSRLGPSERQYKGLDQLARLANDLSGMVHICVAGRGSESDQRELNALGLDVILNPSDRDLAELYSNSDAVVSFSKWEGFNLPLVEGGFFGCPGLALNVGAHQEVTPFCFNSYEELKLYLMTSSIDSLHQDGERMKTFITRFTWEENVTRLIKILESLPVRVPEDKRLPQMTRFRIQIAWWGWKWSRTLGRNLISALANFFKFALKRGRA